MSASAPAPPSKPAAKKGPSAAQKALHKLGLRSDLDLALHLPLRYEDETEIQTIASLRPGQEGQILVTVTHSEVLLRGRRQLLLRVQDGSGDCQLRFFNFYASQQKAWAPGMQLRVRGQMMGGHFERYMLHPKVQTWAEGSSQLPSALTPVYPASAGLPQAYLRKAIASGLSRAGQKGQLAETLPAAALQHMPAPAWPLQQALAYLHQPSPDVALGALEDRSHPAWQRLIAEELLAQQLAQYQARHARQQLAALPLPPAAGAEALSQALLAALPFGLTAAQSRVVAEIGADLASTQPMHRLLQGDVGSGKTVVAALAAAQAMDAGLQCALLAPTEILAEQHFRKLAEWLNPLLEAKGLQLAWLLGSQKKKEKEAQLAAIADGRAALVVGTHALLQEGVDYARLGLVVIDEQHRFGVEQRLALRSKGAQQQGQHHEPHVLMMSATPIPRTLAMSYYADLDVSTIDELPPGRTPILTRALPLTRYEEVVQRLHSQLQEGRQAYWVCPLIEESEALDLGNATERFEALQAAHPDIRCALLHARLPVAEKQAIMHSFQSGETQLLVSTTVIEVGVDVPNASIMVIEHAERFGLSQLHQLRGRVGRGTAASACLLLWGVGESGRLSQTAKARLQAMCESNDGFEIARRDLEIRGPGELMGQRQSGAPLLRFAELERDGAWLEWARAQAPALWQHTPELAEQHLHKWLSFRSEYLKA